MTMPFELMFALLTIACSPIYSVQIGTIHNASLIGERGLEKYGLSCAACACLLAINSTFVSFNCNLANQSCAFFTSYNTTIAYHLSPNLTARFSFVQLPPIVTTTTTTTTTTSVTTTTPDPCSYTVAGRCNSAAGADNSSLNQPIDVFINNNGNILYVGEYGNSRVQAFHLPSTIGITVPASVSGVLGIYYDDDTATLHVTEWTPDKHSQWPSGQTLPISGASKSCSAAGGWYGRPYGVTGDRQGNLYVSHNSCNTIVKWAPNATVPVLIGGTGTSGSTAQQLSSPRHIYLDEVNSFIYVADTNNHRIQKFPTNGSGIGVTVAGGNNAGSASNQLNSPTGVYVSHKDGSIYISDQNNHRVVKWRVNATTGITVAGNAGGGSGNGLLTLNKPFAVVLDRNESYMYIADYSNNRAQKHPVP